MIRRIAAQADGFGIQIVNGLDIATGLVLGAHQDAVGDRVGVFVADSGLG
jgi:hypothetical protein